MASGVDQISRADLALVLSSAADLQARDADAELMSVSEAERIASEVGIAPAEFRTALRALRSSRAGGDGVLGPDGIITAESGALVPVGAADAARMLTQAHVWLPVRASIESPAAGTWRTVSRTTLLQVSSNEATTSIAVTVDRRLTKAALIGGGSWLGTVLGVAVVPALAMAAFGSVEAVAAAQAAGVLGGAAAGFWAGRAAWAQSARRAHSRVLSAVERMREALEKRPHSDEGSRE
jgi:hypothetical protein